MKIDIWSKELEGQSIQGHGLSVCKQKHMGLFWFSAQERQLQCVYMEIANKTQVKATPTVLIQDDQCRITPHIPQSTHY